VIAPIIAPTVNMEPNKEYCMHNCMLRNQQISLEAKTLRVDFRRLKLRRTHDLILLTETMERKLSAT
jgi:hypothetical protein